MDGDRRHGGRPALVTLVVFALVAAACGSDDEAVPTAPPDEAAPAGTTVGDVPPELEFLGDLVGAASEPVTATFDSTAGSLDLADGARVDVPAGAFGEPTELSAVVVDLDFERFADDAPAGTVYVLSTVGDIDLGVPVVLEVPAPVDSVRVVQAVDGVWLPVAVPPGDTTRVPIAHFSTVPTAVVETGTRPTVRGDDPTGEAPAAFLDVCFLTLSWTFAENPEVRIDSFAADLALKFCTRALVDKFTPTGERVELSCVGGKIGGDVDLGGAIEACLAEQDDGAADDPVAAESAPPEEAPDEPASTEPGEPVDIGPLEWAGEMAPTNLGAPFVPDGPASVLITRTPGTDEFEIVLGASITATGTVTGCVITEDKTFEGTGTFTSDTRIDLPGTYVNDRGGTCTDDPVDQELEYAFPLEVTDTGIAGAWEGFTFELSGVPVPIGG